MAQWQAIRKTRHAHATWQPYSNYRFTQNSATCPLLAAEIDRAVANFPIAFMQNGDRFQMVVLHALHPDINLYVNAEGRWLAPYVPAWYRSYPFQIFPADNGQQLLCIDEDSGLFFPEPTGAPNEEPLLTPDGQPAPSLGNMMQFLQKCLEDRLRTQALVDQLAAQQLIIPWPIKVETAENTTVDVNGVFQIDEARLPQLPDAVLAEWARNGALALAHAQLFSKSHLQDFQHRYEFYQRDQAHATQHRAPSPQTLSIDELFGEGQNETIKFNF